MRIFAGAGEPSGDRILAFLLQGLRIHFPNTEIRGFGGSLSEAQGLKSLLPLRGLAVSGIGDVLRRSSSLITSYLRLKRALKSFRPDLVLLVDYPGMNIRLAHQAIRLGYRVHYVAPPQLWAYRAPERRLRRLRKMLAGASLQVLFPMEAGLYSPWVFRLCQGHFFTAPAGAPPSGNRLLLCPGSRSDLLHRNLPLWLNRLSASGWKGGVDVLVPEYLASGAGVLIQQQPDATVLTDISQAFSRAGTAIAFPGTMTLELFLQRIPTCVWAVLDPLTLWAGGLKLRHRFIALPNLLLGKEVFPEWVGTVRDFEHSTPPFSSSLSITPINDGDMAVIQEKMGSTDGVKTGVQACLELLP